MKKTEAEILAHIQTIDETNNLFNQIPKSSQQQFLLNYAAIHFLNKGSFIPSLKKSLETKSSSFTYIQLKLKYMRRCMEAKSNLDNPDFNVLNTLVLWMEALQKLTKNTQPKLVNATLLPHPQTLKFNYYQEYIVYLNYIAIDIQNLFKSNTTHWLPDDFLELLAYSLPRIHYNIILPNQFLGLQSKQQQKQKGKDVLFCNLSVQYSIRTNTLYRSLMKLLIKTVIDSQLKPTQMRSMIDLVSRYYLLFWNDSRQTATQLFITAFSKVTEAVRFSLTDELLLFFRICQKLGANHFLQTLRQKWQWVDSLMLKYGNNTVGHPKDQIYPYNPLQIRQKIVVEAGKSTEKILEIYSEYSLFYFSLDVQDLDINIRLYYLGDFQSNIQIKNVLLSEDKRSQLNKFAFMATKRGLYKIEIDNSYSWINSKKIQFQYAILSQHKNAEYPTWFNHLFQNTNKDFKPEVQSNHQQSKVEPKREKLSKNHFQIVEEENFLITEQQTAVIEQPKTLDKLVKEVPTVQLEEKIQVSVQKQEKKQEEKQEIAQITATTTWSNIQKQVENQKPQSKVLNEELIFSAQSLDNRYEVVGQANLSLIDGIFSLLVSTQDHTYEFETNLEDRIVKRLKNYCQSNEKYQWIANGQARDWLKKHCFSLVFRKGLTMLVATENKELLTTKKSDKKISQ